MLDDHLKKFDTDNQSRRIHDRYVPHQPRSESTKADPDLVGARTTISVRERIRKETFSVEGNGFDAGAVRANTDVFHCWMSFANAFRVSRWRRTSDRNV